MLQDEFGEYWIVFWPDNGEYVNTTYFDTGDDFQQSFDVRSLSFSPQSIAMFTDGLQRLAITYATKEIHAPFIQPMMRALSTAQGGYAKDFDAGLRRFLSSDNVNQRTDDDKTLILAILDNQ